MNSVITTEQANTTRQVRDLLAQHECSLKSTPTEPNKALIGLDNNNAQQQVRDVICSSSDSSICNNNGTNTPSSPDSISDNNNSTSSSSSMRDLCKAVSKKLSLKQQDKQKDRFEKLLQQFKHSNSQLGGEYHVENYNTFDKFVDTHLFSKRIPVSNLLIEEITLKEFAKLYFTSLSQPKQTTFRFVEKEELERRFVLKLMATCSNFRPPKQSLEIQSPSGNEIVLGGNYHDSIYCCEFTLPKMQTKSFLLLEGNSIDSNYRYKQFLHIFRIYGEDLFSMATLHQSRNLCDIIIQFQ